MIESPTYPVRQPLLPTCSDAPRPQSVHHPRACHSHDVPTDLVVRPYQPHDQPVLQQLYTHGLIQRQIEPFDPVADLDNMTHTYFAHPASHAWVAHHRGQLVGLAAAACLRAHEVELRRLLVHAGPMQHVAVTCLLQTLLKHCRRHNILKILIDVPLDLRRIQRLFNTHGYYCTGQKNSRGRRKIEFYINLYQRCPSEPSQT